MNTSIPEVIPVNFGLKYRPAKLGVHYHIKDQPNAHFVHEIPLSCVTRYSDIDDVTDELFEQYTLYLNPRVVSHNQVRRLIERLVKQLGQLEQRSKSPNKENKAIPAAEYAKPQQQPPNILIEEKKEPLVVNNFQQPTAPQARYQDDNNEEEEDSSQERQQQQPSEEEDNNNNSALDQFLGESARRFDENPATSA